MRRVDQVREGFDCVVRAGKVTDPGLVSRPLPPMPMVNCASPQYLARLGTLRTLDDLAQRQLVHYAIPMCDLVAVLPNYRARPMPLALVYANRRNQPARVRVAMDWLGAVVEGYVRRYELHSAIGILHGG